MRLALLLIATLCLTLCEGSTGCTGVRPPTPTSETDISRWPIITAAEEGTVTIQWGMLPQYKRSRAVVVWSTLNETQQEVLANATVQEWFNWHDFPIEKVMVLFKATLTKLPFSTVICYKLIVDNKEMMGGFNFTSPPSAASTNQFSFIAWGDFGIGKEEQPWWDAQEPEAEVAAQMIASGLFNQSSFLMALGDDAYFSGKPHEYDQRTFPYFYDLWARKVLYLTPGNHDYGDDMASPYLSFFWQQQNAYMESHKGRYFSFQWGSLVHFISVDTEWYRYDTLNSPQGMFKWLEDDLKASMSFPWRIVFMHKMPYTEGVVADKNVTSYLVPLFEKYNVSLVLGGHWHNYQRYPPLLGSNIVDPKLGGVTYVISGGGGYAVDGEFVVDPVTMKRVLKKGAGPNDHLLQFAAPAPAPPKAFVSSYHFSYWTIKNGCEATMTAVDRNGSVIDSFSLVKC